MVAESVATQIFKIGSEVFEYDHPYTAPISLKLFFFDCKLNSTRYLFDSLSKRAFDSKLLSTFEI